MIARRVVVHGRVQGVFFRDSARREAERLGVAGWVRNRGDGSVELHAEGPEEAVAALVAWCEEGPPQAEVERAETVAAETEGAAGFSVR